MTRILKPKQMPVNFKKDLGYRCPICSQIILLTDEDGFILHPVENNYFDVIPCPHLICCNVDGNAEYNSYGDWAFIYVRFDIRKKILKLIKEDFILKQELINCGIKISVGDMFLFLIGKYKLDKISCLFANLPIIYEQILPPLADLYRYSYSKFSRIEFAIDTL